jgi:hypothetical protein
MKIVRIASAIVVGTIVSTASNSAMAQAAGNPIPTPARAGFVCPKTIEGTTPGKGAEIRTLLPSGNALDNPAQLRAVRCSSTDTLQQAQLPVYSSHGLLRGQRPVRSA